MTGVSLRHLHVIGVRYRRTHLAPDDERGLDAYETSGVYGSAGVPFDVVEPRFTRQTDEHSVADLGSLNGLIAGEVAAGCREGSAILMTGGDCTHATGVVGGLQTAYGADLRLGLVWLDAHGDFNTPRTSLSGSLGGMPVAVCAGLAHAPWRDTAGIRAPLPTHRIALVGPRNLDTAEEKLLRATDVAIVAPADGFPGSPLEPTIEQLKRSCDALYLHVDADILDASHVPSHGSKEGGGPSLQHVSDAVRTVMASGMVIAFALVSIYNQGAAGRVSVASGIELLESGLRAWREHGMPRPVYVSETQDL